MKNSLFEELGVPQSFVKTARLIVKLAIGAIIALILLIGSVYTINEQEQGVITTLGKPTQVVGSGLHFKIPFVQKLHRIDTTIKGFAIGYNLETGESNPAESMMITSDYNFVNVDFYVEYKVDAPVDYLYNSSSPTSILKNISQSCIRTVVGSYTVDSVLTDGKSEIQGKIKEMILHRLETQNIGIQLVNITMQDAEPPTTEVMQAFKAVETAKQEKETIINNANKYRNEKLPEAEAKVANIIQEANTTKTERINEAEGQVARFNAMYEEYIKNPEITKMRMFYEAMEDILPSLEIIIDSPDNNIQKILPLDSFVDVTNVTENNTTPTDESNNNESEGK